jgi:hypothetical protein
MYKNMHNCTLSEQIFILFNIGNSHPTTDWINSVFVYVLQSGLHTKHRILSFCLYILMAFIIELLVAVMYWWSVLAKLKTMFLNRIG